MSHHTKDKGDIGVLEVQADIGRQGFIVLHPLTEHSPFDIVAYKNGKFTRIQVRYCTAKNTAKGPKIEVRLRNSWNDRYGTHWRDMDKQNVDMLAIYCPQTRQCSYVDPKTVRKSLTLRLEHMKDFAALLP